MPSGFRAHELPVANQRISYDARSEYEKKSNHSHSENVFGTDTSTAVVVFSFLIYGDSLGSMNRSDRRTKD